MSEEDTNETILLVEGRVIHSSLFIKDQFNDQANPSYKIEMAYPEGELDDFAEICYDLAIETWGDGAEEWDSLRLPIKDGNKMAKKREKKGKEGDAYKGMEVLRADRKSVV